MINTKRGILHADFSSFNSSKYVELAGKTIVIKYGGAALEHRELKDPTIHDIAFLQRVGVCVVIVHGGSRQLDKRMREKGLQIRNTDGLRYTCDKTIEEARVVFDEINTEIVDLLQGMGAAAIGLGGESGLIKAKLMKFETYGYVGDVKSVDVVRLKSIIKQGKIPVISALGIADDGQVLNINADDAACAVACSLHADKFIMLTDVEGILQNPRDPSSLISTIDAKGIESLLERHAVSQGMVRKVKACYKAVNAGIPAIHILSARQPHALVTEITGESHYGTQIIGEKSQILVSR